MGGGWRVEEHEEDLYSSSSEWERMWTLRGGFSGFTRVVAGSTAALSLLFWAALPRRAPRRYRGGGTGILRVFGRSLLFWVEFSSGVIIVCGGGCSCAHCEWLCS